VTDVAGLDDWQRAARGSADWSKLGERTEVTFFSEAFAGEDDAASRIADFDILLTMLERTPLPGSLIERLPRLRTLGIAGRKTLRSTWPPAPPAAASSAIRPGDVGAHSAQQLEDEIFPVHWP
jgi:hypothetical protein